MKLNVQFPPSPCYFLSFRSKYSPQRFFSITFNIYSSLKARDRISEPYKSKMIVVLYILIFMFNFHHIKSDLPRMQNLIILKATRFISNWNRMTLDVITTLNGMHMFRRLGINYIYLNNFH
jgi:hypothetical protein